jgi:hypothetical protein
MYRIRFLFLLLHNFRRIGRSAAPGGSSCRCSISSAASAFQGLTSTLIKWAFHLDIAIRLDGPMPLYHYTNCISIEIVSRPSLTNALKALINRMNKLWV